MLKYEAPFEYYIIMDDKGASNIFYEPPIEDIKSIARLSPNPVFLKPKFQRFLKEYEQKGIYCGRPKLMTPKRRDFYKNMWYRQVYEASKQYKDNIEERNRRIKLLQKIRGEN